MVERPDIEADPEYMWIYAQNNRAEGLSSLLENIIQVDMRKQLTDNRRAAFIWSLANGDRERAHTRGTFLAPGKGSTHDPCLIVYIDSGILITDFKTNANLYLARLALWGLALSGIDFRLSRDVGKKVPNTRARSVTHQELPPLSPQKVSFLNSLIEGLSDEVPPGLKTRIRKTIEIFLRREELEARMSGLRNPL